MTTQTNLLPVNAITAELLNKVAKTFFDEDREGVVPAWWPACSEKAKAAMNAEFNEGLLDMMKSALGQVEQHGVEPRVIGGLVLKAMIAGWRMAGLYLSEQLEKTAD